MSVPAARDLPEGAGAAFLSCAPTKGGTKTGMLAPDLVSRDRVWGLVLLEKCLHLGVPGLSLNTE